MTGLRPRRSRAGRSWLIAAAVLVMGLLCVPPAAAHPTLLQSLPASGMVSPTTPDTITLSFTEPVEAAGSAVRVRRLDGRENKTGRATTGNRGATLTVPVDGDLAGGVFEVSWSVLGADGHQVGGTFRFGVVGAGGVQPRGAERLGSTSVGETSQSVDRIEVAARWFGLIASSLLIGGWILARRARSTGVTVPSRWANRISAWAWAFALAAAFESVIAIAAGGADSGRDVELLTGTATGIWALLRVGVLAVLGVAALRFLRPGLFGLAGGLALVTFALDGHTAAVTDDRGLAWTTALAHVGAAGVWAGGLLTLVLWAWLGRAAMGPLLRAFAPVAGVAVAVLAIAGVLSAVREVDSWMFLRWSGYGRIVIVKSVLLLAAVALALWAVSRDRARRSAAGARGNTHRVAAAPSNRESCRRAQRRPILLLRAEAVVIVAVLALAATMAGIVQGRGQPKYAQRGDQLTGAALATAATPAGPLRLTLAPARPGTNTIAAIPAALGEGKLPVDPGAVRVRFACGCGEKDRMVRLRRTATGAWSAKVNLPREGSWFAYAEIDDKAAVAPVALAVNDPHEGGPAPFVVRATADLTGRQALSCRNYVQGLAMGVGRLNARGGADGGRKVVLDVRDDGGNPARAARIVRDDRPDALSPCGAGGSGAVAAADGAVALVGDPSTPGATAPRATTGRVFRLALDPFVEGVGIGQHLEATGLRNAAGTPRRVGVVVRDAAGKQRAAGLRSVLGPRGLSVEILPTDAGESVAGLRRFADPDRYLATVLDGDVTRVATALRRIGGTQGLVPLSSLFAAQRLGTEAFMLESGALGRLGAIRTAAEVTPDSRDGLVYSGAVGAIFRGERPSLSGLRGYVTGLTLAEALVDGTDGADMTRRLAKPRRYTDGLTRPWSEDAPARGAQAMAIYGPNFLPSNLRPVSVGGMAYAGTYFQTGAWTRVDPAVYGPRTAAAPGR